MKYSDCEILLVQNKFAQIFEKAISGLQQLEAEACDTHTESVIEVKGALS